MFDLDGTLIDSRADIVTQVNASLAACGLETRPPEVVGRLIGRGSRYLFRRLLGDDFPDPRLDQLVARFRQLYALHLADATRVYPGVIEALEHYRGLPKVIVTNKPQDFADSLVDRLGLREHFAAVFGAEAFARQKPDPLPVLETCRRYSENPASAAFIGDSCVDLEASRGAGTLTVSAFWGYEDAPALRAMRPDIEIHAARELIGLFDG